MSVTPIPDCGSAYPTVLNGNIVSGSQRNVAVEYECAAGFYMTGNKRITCSNSTGAWIWEAAPTCSVIHNSDIINVSNSHDIIEDWWFYVIAGILGLLVLSCLLCVICHFCCAPRADVVVPYDDRAEGGFCLCCTGRRSGRRDVVNYDDNHSHGVRSPSQVGRNCVCWVSSHDVTRTQAKQTQWNRGSRDSEKLWKNSFKKETVMKSDNDDPRGTQKHKHPHSVQPVRPAKEVKSWMPHSHPVRGDHNTSTK